MAARKDGLPEPVSVADMYLAAILDEIRGLRQDQAPTQSTQPPDSIRVKEPAPRKR